ncbi:unnamed protein product [Gongylonema pulchrum]|uniref:Transmembrane protein n=1 Tax=Gongylonema pulchrum TaxID=637853 RepID=A0A183ELU6_9BILA|nr:unnamed protein product [Gongylonema pulchrum]
MRSKQRLENVDVMVESDDGSSSSSLMLDAMLWKVLAGVCLYYPLSIGLTFYQKWFIKVRALFFQHKLVQLIAPKPTVAIRLISEA